MAGRLQLALHERHRRVEAGVGGADGDDDARILGPLHDLVALAPHETVLDRRRRHDTRSRTPANRSSSRSPGGGNPTRDSASTQSSHGYTSRNSSSDRP